MPLNLLFPKRCLGCGCWGSYFCGRCRRGRRIKKKRFPTCLVCGRPAFQGSTHQFCRTKYTPDRFISFLVYQDITKRAIKKLKYKLVTDLAEELAFLALRSRVTTRNYPFLKSQKRVTLLPIPLHPKRQRSRGFNQAVVLARVVAESFGWSLEERVLSRIRSTQPQASLGREERRANIKDCFQADKPRLSSLKDQTLIVFDDVATTGSTLREAVKVLKKAGAKRVWGMSLAS